MTHSIAFLAATDDVIWARNYHGAKARIVQCEPIGQVVFLIEQPEDGVELRERVRSGNMQLRAVTLHQCLTEKLVFTTIERVHALHVT